MMRICGQTRVEYLIQTLKEIERQIADRESKRRYANLISVKIQQKDAGRE